MHDACACTQLTQALEPHTTMQIRCAQAHAPEPQQRSTFSAPCLAERSCSSLPLRSCEFTVVEVMVVVGLAGTLRGSGSRVWIGPGELGLKIAQECWCCLFLSPFARLNGESGALACWPAHAHKAPLHPCTLHSREPCTTALRHSTGRRPRAPPVHNGGRQHIIHHRTCDEHGQHVRSIRHIQHKVACS